MFLARKRKGLKLSRKKISKRVRFEIFKRDDFSCLYCGKSPPDAVLEVDHIVPVCEGGGNDTENLATACYDCNRGKSGIPLSKSPESLVSHHERQKEMREQMEAMSELIRERQEKLHDWTWEIAEILKPGASEGWPSDKVKSVMMFIERIGYPQTLDAAIYSSNRISEHRETHRFKYFCSVCWGRYREAKDQ